MNAPEIPRDLPYPLEEFVSKNEFSISNKNPLSEAEFFYLFKNRETNGFSKAFVRINARKYLVHLPTFIECLTERLGA